MRKIASFMLVFVMVLGLMPVMQVLANPVNLSVTNLSSSVNGRTVSLTAHTTTGRSDVNGRIYTTWEIVFDSRHCSCATCQSGELGGTETNFHSPISNLTLVPGAGRRFTDTFHNRPYGRFRARCMTRNDWGDESRNWSAWTDFEIRPPAPTNLRTSGITATSANLAWNWNSANVQGYNVQIRQGTSVIRTVEVRGRTNETITGLPLGTYTFRVQAFSHGAVGSWSSDSPSFTIEEATRINSVEVPTGNIPASGGARTRTITVRGANLSNNIQVIAATSASGTTNAPGVTVGSVSGSATARTVTITFPANTAATAVTYHIRARTTNPAGDWVSGNNTVTVDAAAGQTPMVTDINPRNQTVTVGESVTFSVTANAATAAIAIEIDGEPRTRSEFAVSGGNRVFTASPWMMTTTGTKRVIAYPVDAQGRRIGNSEVSTTVTVNALNIRAYDIRVDTITSNSARFTGRYPFPGDYPNNVDRVEFSITNMSTGVRTEYRSIQQGEGSWYRGSFWHIMRGLSAGTQYQLSVRTMTRDGRYAHAEPVTFTTTGGTTGGGGGNLDVRPFPRGSTGQIYLNCGRRTNFRASEFDCPCGCGPTLVSMLLIEVLQEIRDHFTRQFETDTPLIITSGFRCGAAGFHGGGTAADFHVLRHGVRVPYREVYNVAKGILTRRGIFHGDCCEAHRAGRQSSNCNYLYGGNAVWSNMANSVHIGVGRNQTRATALHGDTAYIYFDGFELFTDVQGERTFTINFDPLLVSNVSAAVSGDASNVRVNIGNGIVTVTLLPLSSNFSVEFGATVNANVPAHTQIPITLVDNLNALQTIEGMITVMDDEELAHPIDPDPPTTTPGQPVTTPGLRNGIVLSAIVTPIGVNFDWTPANNALGYRIYRSTTPGGEGISISDFPLRGSSFFDANVLPGRTYYYTIARVTAEASFDIATVTLIPEQVGPRSEELTVSTIGIVVCPDCTRHDLCECPDIPARGFIMMTIGDPFMIVNEETLEIDPGRGTTPLITSGRTMVPIRAIVESMGGTVGWDEAERRIDLTGQGNSIIMHLNSRDMTVNGVPKEMDIAPFISNDRTLLPVRFVAENLGTQIEWIGSLQRVVIVFDMET